MRLICIPTTVAARFRKQLFALAGALMLLLPGSAFAQGSIFGTVQNSDLSTPADGDILFVGFLDDTDEEIRLESSDGAGYESGNWFDDFQNYLTEAAGNPYDYYFVNTANGEAFHLAKPIPNNSFEQENIILAAASLPSRPTGLSAQAISSSSMEITWNSVAGLTYHVYRRLATSNGSFFRIDNTSGSLSDPGVNGNSFVDNTVDGASAYDYVIIAENASGDFSAHSAIVTASSASAAAPIVTSIDPVSGPTVGGTDVTISGSGFDLNGATVTIGGAAASGVTVVSTGEITASTPVGTAGAVDVIVQNIASGLADTLVGGFTYYVNTPPVADAGPDQLGRFKNTVIALDGSGSSDVDGDSLGYHWSQVSGPESVALSDTNVVGPTFTVSTNGTYVFELLVDDAIAYSTADQVSIEVVERAPVLATIGSQAVTEGQNLNFNVSASDPDGTIPGLTAENLPANATFDDNLDGTGTFDFNPTFQQTGVYNITFIASDGILADTEIVAITVNDAGNQAPVLASIGAQSVTEGQNLNFGVSAGDPDGTIPGLRAENIPANSTFNDNGDGSGTFDFNPDFTQAGVYNVTFIADDGVLEDTEIVAITVNDGGNQAPVLAAIGTQSVTEGQNLNVGVSATDVDGTTPSLRAENAPTNSNFTDNGDGTGSFDFSPDFTQAGVYNVRFIASDGTLEDTELVEITVNEAGNQAPVLASIGAQATTEGVNLNFGVSASDPDGTTPGLRAENIPVNSTFNDNGDGTGTFDFTPDFTQAGVYNVTFIADDGVLEDTETVAITVNDAGNQAPVLAAIGPQSVTEGLNLNFNISATDADNTTPLLRAEDLPATATFNDNTDGTGTFDFNPDFTQAGVYNVTFIASDGTLEDTEVVEITVNDAGNQAPVLAAIGAQSVTEGQNLNVGVSASDPDATIPGLRAENLPLNATFVDNGDGTGVFDFNPVYVQAGIYNVTFIADDGTLEDTEAVEITVLEAGNQAPALATIGSQFTSEGLTLNFTTTATDPDSTIPGLRAENLPANASFVDNGDGSGDFSFSPDFTQAGIYDVTFIADDGVLEDTEIVAITVNDAGNQAPVLAAIGAQSVTEGLNLNFNISASDPDSTIPNFAAENLPSNATFVDNLDGTGTFDFTPDFTQAGVYSVRFIASDGTLADTEIVDVTVIDAGNQVPVLAAIGVQSTTEGVNLNFGVSASDPDSTFPALTAENLPANATFVDNGDGTGVFDFTPEFTQAGLYNVRFIADDGALADTELVEITVNEAGNQAPTLATIGAQTIAENTNLNLAITATDPDSTIPTLTAENLPANATFVDNGDGSGVFDFTPDFTQAGVYSVRFIASDGVLSDTELVDVTVTDANQPPVLANIGSRSVTEGNTLALAVSASDADNDPVTLSAENLPANASFVDNGNNTGNFSFSPDFTQAGVYNVTFKATDGVDTDSEVVQITVIDSGNQPPVIADLADQVVEEGDTLGVLITATDADGTIPALSAFNLPTNATFVDSGNGSGFFEFAPDLNQAGQYQVAFIATDGAAADTALMQVLVVESGAVPPVLASIGPKVVSEGNVLTILLSATDDSSIPSLAVSTEMDPSDYVFVDSGNGKATFEYSPDYYDAGVDSVRFLAIDSDELVDFEDVEITTLETNRPPAIAMIPDVTVLPGDSLRLRVVATDSTDFDGGRIFLTALAKAPGSVFTDSTNNAGSLRWKPTIDDTGSYNFILLASDNDTPTLSDRDSAVVTVLVTNQPPVLASIGPKSGPEGEVLTFGFSATDPEGTVPSFSAQNLPQGAVLADSGNGAGSFSWQPNFQQAGLYSVKIRASDGNELDEEQVLIQVSDVPQPPEITVPDSTFVFTEGETIEFFVSATDPDLTTPELFLDSLVFPPNASFTDNGDGTGRFTFSPVYVQAGLYDFNFIASDGVLADTGVVQVEVLDAGNQLPELTAIRGGVPLSDLETLTFTEGDSIGIRILSSDADSVPAILSSTTLPFTATLVDSGNGRGYFVWKTTNLQLGTYNITFYATDGDDPALQDSIRIIIDLLDLNADPRQVAIIPSDLCGAGVCNLQMNEGDSLEFLFWSDDPDETDPVLKVVPVAFDGSEYTILYEQPAPRNIFVEDQGDTATFLFAPDFQQAGRIRIALLAIDEFYPTVIKSKILEIDVFDVSVPPVLDPIGALSVVEGSTLDVNIVGRDPDGTAVTLTAEGLPPGATFTALGGQPAGQATSQLLYTPGFTDAGVYNVLFFVREGSGEADSELVDITVIEAGPQPPSFLNADGSYVIAVENDMVELWLQSTDPDSPTPTLTIEGTPEVPWNAVFVDSGNGNGSFAYDPLPEQADSIYNVRVISSDGSLDDTLSLTLEVVDAICGDANSDLTISITDGVFIINYIFGGGPAPATLRSGDPDCSGSTTITDAVYLINFIFGGGPAPCMGPDCP